jgi:hypothetical protein
MIKVAFALTHPDFRGLPGNGFIRKCPDPEPSALIQLPRKDYSDRFDLGILKPAVFKGLKTVLAKRKRTPCCSNPSSCALLQFTVFYSLRHQGHIS